MTLLADCPCSSWQHVAAVFKIIFMIVLGGPAAIALLIIMITCAIWLVEAFISDRRALLWREAGRRIARGTRRFTRESKSDLDQALSYLTTHQRDCQQLGKTTIEHAERLRRRGLSACFGLTPWDRGRRGMYQTAHLATRLLSRAIATHGVARTPGQLADLHETRREIRAISKCCKTCASFNEKRQRLSGDRGFEFICMIEQRAYYKDR